MDHHKRHAAVWKILRPLVMAFMRLRYNFHWDLSRVKGPCLVLSNHNTDLDPLLLSCSFPDQMYFVASEHIFRQGFISKALRWLVAPIARVKGASAADTVLTVMRTLKKGGRVCIFPEGNRSWNGLTNSILPSTGKLARSCGASLVTYRLERGYLASPRWCGSSMRRGRIYGRVVGVYTPEQLKAMTPAEVNAIIVRDLSEDVYQLQAQEPVAFHGRRLAEHLECALYICPRCGGLSTLSSHGNHLSCNSCGMDLTYTEQGTFTGDDPPFENVRDWDLWQTERLQEICDSAESECIFSDDCMELIEVMPDHSDKCISRGRVSLYRDRLCFEDLSWPIEDISGMSIRRAQTMQFSAGKDNYEVISKQVRCTYKYMRAYEYIKQANKALTEGA